MEGKERPLFLQNLLDNKSIHSKERDLMIRLVLNADDNGVVKGLTVAQLRADMSMSEKTLRVKRDRLEAAGLLVTTKESRQGCNLRSCVYTIEQEFFKQITGDNNE